MNRDCMKSMPAAIAGNGISTSKHSSETRRKSM
jgi:hypothetical protein